MNKELIENLKYLRLGGLLAHWDEHLKLAAESNLSHTRLLTHVLEEECRIKRENARRLRLKRARVPEPLVIETFPFERQPKLNKKSGDGPLRLVGLHAKPSESDLAGGNGCGKTGLATSFLLHAIEQGYSGRYVLFAELIAELYRSVGDHSETKVLKKYLAFDCFSSTKLATSRSNRSKWGCSLPCCISATRRTPPS